jgi:hypothetical protein
MAKISGDLNESCRILVYDTQTNTLVKDEVESDGSYEYIGLTSYDKHVIAINESTGQLIGYGNVTPASEPPVEATYNVTSGGDDGYAYTAASAFYTNLDNISIGNGNFVVFVRFNNIPIPQGSTIEYAFLRFRCRRDYNETSDKTALIYANDVNNAIAPISYADSQTKVKTSQVVNWSMPKIHTTVNLIQNSPDISILVSAVVGRPGWVSGNAIQFIFGAATAGTGRAFASFENTTLPAPELHLRFVAP